MTDIEYKNTLCEVSVILKNMDKFLVSKIPENVKKKIEEDKSQNYKFEYNFNKGLSEQKMLKTTKLYLTMLFLRFLCTEEEKKEILKIMNENEAKYKEELLEKQKMYSANNIFKENATKKSVVEEKQDNLQMVKYKENIFSKFFNKIKNMLKKR